MVKVLIKVKIGLWVSLILVLALSACLFSEPESSPALPEAGQPELTPSATEIKDVSALPSKTAVRMATETDIPMDDPTPTETSVPTATSKNEAEIAATTVEVNLNPLTNQPCQDSSLLNLPPALVSVSNFPVTARPQAGLSYAPYVFEMYIGEGMTRFLALFYCAFPEKTVSGDNTIGPIRSGRLPYESLRKLYNGFLIMASASGEVGAQLGDATNVFGSDESNINSALVDVSKLKGIAQRQAGQEPPNLSGNVFDPTPPSNGLPAERLWLFYNFLNQVMWTYDTDSGAYLRAQDQADGSGQFIQSTDRLTGEPLEFENVIVLFADHEVLNSEGTLIDLDLLYTLGKAYLFRDGLMIPIRWSTENGDYEKQTGRLRPIRFVDQAGNSVALKPGHVWVEFVHLTTTISETQPGSWKVRFYAP